MKRICRYILLCSVLAGQVSCHTHEIRVDYLGHSSFLINFENKISVLTDYGKPNAWKNYGWDSPIHSIGNLNPDIATYSHQHLDHFDISRIDTTLTLLYMGEQEFRYKGLVIKSFPTSEKDISTADNNSYIFEYKGIKILHLGDCQANIMSLKDPVKCKLFLESIPEDLNILMFPIEGSVKYLPQAAKVIELIDAETFMPMHYWSEKYKNDFLDTCSGMHNVKILRSHNSFFRLYPGNKRKLKTVVSIQAAKLNKNITNR